MKYRIPEPGTTISRFADSKKKINADWPSIFLTCDHKHTYIFLALQWPELWKIKCNTRSEKKDS
jgi:hypothetical protein